MAEKGLTTKTFLALLTVLLVAALLIERYSECLLRDGSSCRPAPLATP